MNKSVLTYIAVGGAAILAVKLISDPSNAMSKQDAYLVSAALPVMALMLMKAVKVK